MDREAITAALFARLDGINGIKTKHRRVRHFDDVQPSEMPALFLGLGPALAVQQRGLPGKWQLSWSVYLYARETGPQGPSPKLNELITQVEAALVATPEEIAAANAVLTHTTLGGRVLHTWISDIDTDEGSFGALGVAIVRIEALVI